jgi:hypothetical protein
VAGIGAGIWVVRRHFLAGVRITARLCEPPLKLSR